MLEWANGEVVVRRCARPAANLDIEGRITVIKVVDSTQYHLWTDALHGRALARQARNDWDRGTYVRWTILSAWSAFETVCGDALGASGLGMRFREGFDKAVVAKGIPAVDWGKGLWQQALQVYGIRKEFTHVQPTIAHNRLLAPVEDAERAITVLRAAIKEVCNMTKQPSPVWADDDSDRGWDAGSGSICHAMVIKDGADPEGADTVKIAYIMEGKEHVCDILPPGTDYGPVLDDLIKRLIVPVGVVRAYRGKDLMEERKLQVRGAN
jgi:hypothetical protein